MASSSTTFRKGESFNPKGRPLVMKDLKLACQEMVPEIVAALKLALTKPSERVPAAALALAYGFGKPVARVEHRLIRSMADLSDEELAALIASGDPDADDDDPLAIAGPDVPA